jgi:hypothetical protein
MKQKIKCWFGRHKWLTNVSDEKHKVCLYCGKEKIVK